MWRHAEEQSRTPQSGLHVCPACNLPFAIPTEVVDVSNGGEWHLLMSCTSCDFRAAVTCDDDAVEALDLEMERCRGAMEQAAEELHQSAERDHIAAFATALSQDLIVPDDF